MRDKETILESKKVERYYPKVEKRFKTQTVNYVYSGKTLTEEGILEAMEEYAKELTRELLEKVADLESENERMKDKLWDHDIDPY